MDARRLTATISIIGSSLLFVISAQAQSVLYVDINATGPTHDGSSWCDGFTNLQDALGAATSGDEIRVASGTYTPDGGSGDRTATFQLLNGVALLGAYAGCGADDPDERDIPLYETVLSGDLFGNDGPDFENNVENSYHVVTGSDTDETALLDGFTITGGNANGPDSHDYGGGMYNCTYAGLTIANCIFTGNSANHGGGMFNLDGDQTLINCIFTGNSAEGTCGGMYSIEVNQVLTNCTFAGNSAGGGGGGIGTRDCNQVLIHCIFIGNSAGGSGGGMYNLHISFKERDSSVKLVNCTFVGNSAASTVYGGGGMYNEGSYNAYGDFFIELENCTLAGNSADRHGGGMYFYGSFYLTIANTIFWGNTDNGGTDQSAQIGGSLIPFTEYCCIQGWTGSLGGFWNNGDDPLFADADGPDGIPGTEDDNLRLTAGSSCIDSGGNWAVPTDVTTDLDGNPRFVDDPDTVDTGIGTPPIVDRGAYEYHPADCNGNGIPDDEDIAEGTSEDCQPNGIPDECDVALSDCNSNGVPDDCDPDFDGDGTPDDCDPDIDGDGVPNESDACDDTPPGHQINPSGGPMGDWDDNCYVDLNDHCVFEICLGLSGPGGDPVFEDCTDVFDFDGDGDVDLWDFAAFQRAFTGVGP